MPERQPEMPDRQPEIETEMTVSSSMSTPPRSGPSIPPPPSQIPIVAAPPIKVPAPAVLDCLSDDEDNADDVKKPEDPKPIKCLDFPDFSEKSRNVWENSHMKFNCNNLLQNLENVRLLITMTHQMTHSNLGKTHIETSETSRRRRNKKRRWTSSLLNNRLDRILGLPYTR